MCVCAQEYVTIEAVIHVYCVETGVLKFQIKELFTLVFFFFYYFKQKQNKTQEKKILRTHSKCSYFHILIFDKQHIGRTSRRSRVCVCLVIRIETAFLRWVVVARVASMFFDTILLFPPNLKSNQSNNTHMCACDEGAQCN